MESGGKRKTNITIIQYVDYINQEPLLLFSFLGLYMLNIE